MILTPSSGHPHPYLPPSRAGKGRFSKVPLVKGDLGGFSEHGQFTPEPPSNPPNPSFLKGGERSGNMLLAKIYPYQPIKGEGILAFLR
jgi:hypothetical protein